MDEDDPSSYLGKGKFGQVYIGHKLQLNEVGKPIALTGEKRAVKCIDKKKQNFNQEYLKGEIEVYKKMAKVFKDSSHLLRMHNIFESSNHLYIVMDLCLGGDLYGMLVDRQMNMRGLRGGKNKQRRQNEDIWAQGRGLKESEAIKILYHVISGLCFMNKHNVFHRDIKPANVMYDRQNDLYKLTDYGLAKVVGENNPNFTLGKGTPLYLAPEAWYQKKYKYRYHAKYN
jgi:serine/threonine protein kinase